MVTQIVTHTKLTMDISEAMKSNWRSRDAAIHSKKDKKIKMWDTAGIESYIIRGLTTILPMLN